MLCQWGAATLEDVVSGNLCLTDLEAEDPRARPQLEDSLSAGAHFLVTGGVRLSLQPHTVKGREALWSHLGRIRTVSAVSSGPGHLLKASPQGPWHWQLGFSIRTWGKHGSLGDGHEATVWVRLY